MKKRTQKRPKMFVDLGNRPFLSICVAKANKENHPKTFLFQILIDNRIIRQTHATDVSIT